jgi:hypothetical protein
MVMLVDLVEEEAMRRRETIRNEGVRAVGAGDLDSLKEVLSRAPSVEGFRIEYLKEQVCTGYACV